MTLAVNPPFFMIISILNSWSILAMKLAVKTPCFSTIGPLNGWSILTMEDSHRFIAEVLRTECGCLNVLFFVHILYRSSLSLEQSVFLHVSRFRCFILVCYLNPASVWRFFKVLNKPDWTRPLRRIAASTASSMVPGIIRWKILVISFCPVRATRALSCSYSCGS